ncbi:spore germination lipoprotein GerD [Fictibacillus sp. Mic-4]|uniref:spore germination lipoprotein GerD n=1 Tax=Fictibacillus sp. Mic-4 TaxID=3132826 RepID=UPI003CF70D04
MKKKTWIVVLFCFLLFAINGCAQNEAQGVTHTDYEATKKMLVDLLKTEDGKKAIKEVLSDEKMKQQLLLDQNIVKMTIEQQLLSEKGQKFWENAFKDPKFAQTYAKSLKKEHEQLLKSLMNDPAYQQQMMKILQNPNMAKKALDLVHTTQMQNEMKKVMLETFKSPLIKAQISDMVTKAAHEEIAQTGEKEKGEKKQGGK